MPWQSIDWAAISSYGFAAIVAVILLSRGFQILREMEKSQHDAVEQIVKMQRETSETLSNAIGTLNATLKSFQVETRLMLIEIRRQVGNGNGGR